MTGICDGRVVIVTGAGRGIGRGHALEFARQGAKVVVNDLGADVDGTGSSTRPRPARWSTRSGRLGGEAVANGDDVSDWKGAERLSTPRVETFGGLDVLVNNAGILRDRMLVNMTEDEWDAVIHVHLKGTFGPARCAAALLAGAGQGRRDGRRPHHQHVVHVGHLRQPRPDQLRRRQGGHRRVHDHRRPGARPLRRDRQRHRPRRPHPHDREPPRRRPRCPGPASSTAAPPENIAPLVVWLGSPESQGVTGQVFLVGGGRIGVARGLATGVPASTRAPAGSPRSCPRSFPRSSPRQSPRPDQRVGAGVPAFGCAGFRRFGTPFRDGGWTWPPADSALPRGGCRATMAG